MLHEYLYLLGLLKPGVIVHAHDIFTRAITLPSGSLSADTFGMNNTYLRRF